MRRAFGKWYYLVALSIFLVVGAYAAVMVMARYGFTRDDTKSRFLREIVGDLGPTWSPDGTRVAIASDEGENYDIYVTSADGSGRTNLTNSPDEDTHPAWSPDGGRIAFLSQGQDGSGIHVIRPDGTGHADLTSFPALYMQLSWSPDGARIAFASNRDVPDPWWPAGQGVPLDPPPPDMRKPDVYVMNADGSDQTRLTFDEAFDGEPSWSPDGSRIVFQSMRDGNSEIYVMNADGSLQTRLTYNDWPDITPAWSPDGTLVAFASRRLQTEFGEQLQGWLPPFDIYVMNADGSGQTNLTNNIGTDNTRPAWSPDGLFIAFDGRYRAPLAGLRGNNEIYLMGTAGIDGGLARLTHNSAYLDPDRNKGPVWSPDGRFIAFVSKQTGAAGVRLIQIPRDEPGRPN